MQAQQLVGLGGTAHCTTNGSFNFDGTAIDNIGGSLHFDGTEDGVEDGSLDSGKGKLDGSLDSDGTADGTYEGSLFFDGKAHGNVEACPTSIVQRMAWTTADLNRISSTKASSMARTRRHSRWNSRWLH
jgi:hypothetical protein